MKNFRLYLLSLVCLLLPVTAFAQLEELKHKSITIAEHATTDLVANDQWYLVRTHWQYSSDGYICDYWGEYYSLLISDGLDVVYDGMTATSASQYLIRFLSIEPSAGDLHDKYYMQFGTGNYLMCYPGYYYGYDMYFAMSSMGDATPMYVYLAQDTPYCYTISTADEDVRMDSFGPGSYIIGSDSGETTDLTYLDDIWFLTPVTLDDMDPHEEAILDLGEAYSDYYPYRDSFTPGTDAGCYGADEVAAFQAAIDAAAQVLDDPDMLEVLTADEINAYTQAITDTYEALLESYIALAIDVPEGYYYFNSVVDFYEVDSETGATVYPTKGMYSEENADGTIYAKWKTTDGSCPFLWKVTDMGDKTYDIVNMATDARFNTVATSTNVTMSPDSENLMVFDAGVNEYAGQGFVNIRVSTQPEGDYYYLHCGGHSNGAGVADYIVGWVNTAGASTWQLVAVDDETAEAIIEAYAPVKDAQNRYLNAQNMITDAEAKMALTGNVSISTTKLITSVDQLSSPYTEVSEGSLDNLLDGDSSTFWHSDWTDGTCDPGIHYLQADLISPVDYFVFTFTRRPVTDDHITEWGVYGAPSDDAAKSECTFLAEIYTPFNGDNTETLTSNEIASKGFTKLRFYFEDTYYSGGSSRGYAHMSEFQLYEAVEKENSQKAMLGDIYTNLEDAIAVARAEGEDITIDTYNALKTAYDAFIEAFVDPTELRTALELANNTMDGIVIGSNPGEWTDSSVAGTLENTVAEATAYDDACVYTQEQSDAYVASIDEQIANVKDAANKVQTGKWYEIRFATEEEMESNGWSTSNAAETDTDESLFGKYAVVADWHTDDGVNYVDPMSQDDLYSILMGHNVFFDDKDDIQYEDYAKFRFVNVGDTAYMMQNKATGLFLKAAGTSGYVTLSINPSLFTVSAIGYGENLISATSVSGTSQNNLHAQLSYNGLVTWSATEAGTNSGLFIEDINEDVASDYDGTEFNMSIVEGALYTHCYPVSVTANEGTMYGVYAEGTTITLAPLDDNTAEPGQPFAYINGDPDNYDSSYEADYIVFNHGYDVNSEAQSVGDFVGTYSSVVIGSGKIVASGNTFVVSTGYTYTVSANGAYIDGEYDVTDTITVEFSDEAYDSVEEVVAAVAMEGNIYSIDGKFLGKGNVNTVKSFGKGIYIINGVKVAVK